MFDEVVALLGGFQNFILCMVIGLVLVAVITLVGFSVFGLEHPFLGWFALFLNDKRRRTVLLTLSLVRMFYQGAMVGMVKAFNLTQILVYVLLSIFVWVVEMNLFYFIYDLIYSVGVMGISYLLYLMHVEISKVHFQSGMRVLMILFSCLLVSVAIGQFFIAISPAKGKTNANRAEEKMKKLSLGILPCLFLVLIVPYFMITYTNSISLEQGALLYTGGEKIEIGAGSKISKTDIGQCMVTDKSSSFIASGGPIYDRGSERVIFTEYNSIVRPRLQITNRVSPMCILEEDGGTYYIRNGEQQINVDNFFFFDGNDTYYFPGQTVLTFGEQQIVIDSFTRVEVVFNQKIEIFEYETQELSLYENVTGFCTAKLFGSEQLNLSTDILYRESGEEQMLFMQPMLLKELE